MSTNLYVQTEDGIEKYPDVADAAEVTKGRLQIVSLDGETEFVDGTLFGAFGEWKMWLDDGQGIATIDPAFRPLTMPQGHIRFHYDGRKYDRAGAILRLRRTNLPNP